MNEHQAKEELSFHSGRNSDIDDPRWQAGFLGSLRPYQGMSLVEENFHKIIECLRIIAPALQNNDNLSKSLVSDVSGILCLGKAWAVHKDGMLLRNNIINEMQAQQIDNWLDCISYAWMMLLDTQYVSLAFEVYDEEYKI